MSKVVRRIGRHPDEHLIVLETDSTDTTALTVSADAYTPGRDASNYDSEDVAQIDNAELAEVEDPQMLWALFSDEKDDYSTRLSMWMPEDQALEELRKLHDSGEWWVYPLSKEV